MLKLACILSFVTAALSFFSIFVPLDSLHGGLLSIVLVTAAIITTYFDYAIDELNPPFHGPASLVLALFYSPLRLVDFGTVEWQFLDLAAGLLFLVEAIRITIVLKEKSQRY